MRLRTGLALPFGVLLACSPGLGCRPASPAERLAREIAGAYPERAAPTGVVRTFDIEAREAELPLVDGGKLRVWAYNGQVPGPELRIRLGETLRVRFTNRLPQPTTIHWHGVRVPNGMDGVPSVTQPPVEPGATFVYEFTPKDAGTFWFHPHVRSSEQVERGLYGVLIVEDRAPAPYARDVVWVLDDWLLDETRQIFGAFNTPHDLMHDGAGATSSPSTDAATPPSPSAAASGSGCASSTPRTPASTRPTSARWNRRSSRSTVSTWRGRSRSGASSWRRATGWTWTSPSRPRPPAVPFRSSIPFMATCPTTSRTS